MIDLGSDRHNVYRKQMEIIFQNPYSSLNLPLTIGEAITDPIRVHQI
ncbi:MAG: hypothetical protein ACMUEM_02515 [Flavobacteriales bacterium AspAUS03]